LILASTLHDAGGLAAIVSRSRTPVVVVDRELELPGVDMVLADNVRGAYAATSHLVGLGHRRIGCIAGAWAELLPTAGRMEGYRSALTEAGIEPDPRWIVEGDFEYLGGREAVARLLDADPSVTAVFAMNDQMAIGALDELAARAVHVPEEFSVCGFDDAFPAALVSPRLTTVRQPLAELGRAAVELLLARIQGAAPDEPVRRLFPTELVVRESTAALRRLAVSAPRRGST
jgi:LacI family transcriptional regulator